MKINKKLIVIIISIISLLEVLTATIIINKNKSKNQNVKNKYVNIDKLVYEAYTSKNGYNSNMKKHMDIKVYTTSNICNRFLKLHGKAPDTIDFKLNEINQHKINNKIFVYMKYGYKFIDPIWKIESGEWNTPVIFQVVEKDGEPYIEKKTEYDADCDVPKEYR